MFPSSMHKYYTIKCDFVAIPKPNPVQKIVKKPITNKNDHTSWDCARYLAFILIHDASLFPARGINIL